MFFCYLPSINPACSPKKAMIFLRFLLQRTWNFKGGKSTSGTLSMASNSSRSVARSFWAACHFFFHRGGGLVVGRRNGPPQQQQQPRRSETNATVPATASKQTLPTSTLNLFVYIVYYTWIGKWSKKKKLSTFQKLLVRLSFRFCKLGSNVKVFAAN